MKPLRVLSLFDGISCGQLALDRARIPVEVYYASEIDKYAIQITQKNYPGTIQLGDVNNIDFTEFIGKVDLIMGGSPCQDLSIAGKRAGLKGERSGLFYKFVEAIEVVKPRYFLLENNYGMPQEAYEEISRLMGCYPIMINSALVSAQTRKRFYWTNIGPQDYNLFGFPTVAIPQPENKEILLKDVLESGYTPDDKNRCIQSSICRTTEREYFLKHQGQVVFNINPSGKGQNGNVYHIETKSPTITTNKGEGIKILEPVIYQLPRGNNNGGIKKDKATTITKNSWEFNNLCVKPCALRNRGNGKQPEFNNTDKANALTSVQTDSMVLEPKQLGHISNTNAQANRVYSVHNKSVTLKANGGGGGAKTGLYKIDLPDGEYLIRKLTPLECERLQTLPDGYTEGVSNTQRYKTIGNGWTVDVIAHIFSFLN